MNDMESELIMDGTGPLGHLIPLSIVSGAIFNLSTITITGHHNKMNSINKKFRIIYGKYSN